MRTYVRMLRNRPFAVLWGGSTLSAMGDAMTWVALVWIAFERGGAGLVSGLYGFLKWRTGPASRR